MYLCLTFHDSGTLALPQTDDPRPVDFSIVFTYTKMLEVNLFAFAYRLFHEDFSSIDGPYKSSPSSTLPFVIREYIREYIRVIY